MSDRVGTFSAGRGGGQQPYFFKCAIVRSAIKRLIQRHAVFLIVMVLIETIAFDLTPYMPPSWLVAEGRGTSPFAMGLFIICFCLALVEILTNRSLLERAHRERQVLP